MSRARHHNPTRREPEGKFALEYHMEMVSDSERTNRCRLAIEQVVEPDMAFCEIGCGTGIFTVQAANICRKVYAIEIDPVVLEIAKGNVHKAGLSSRVEFLLADACTVTLNEPVDVIFCEMMSIWLVNEPQVPMMNHAREHFLKKNGSVIPGKVINLFELGQFDYLFDSTEIRAPLPQFTGVKSPRIMTESKVANVIELTEPTPDEMNVSKKLEVLLSGTLNCVRLTSLVQFAPGVNFYSTDSLMPATIVPLDSDVTVAEGDLVRFEASYRHHSRIEDSQFRVTKLG